MPNSAILAHVHPELRAAGQQMLNFPVPTEGKTEIAQLVGYRSLMPTQPPLADPAVEKIMVSGRDAAPDVPIYVINARSGESRPLIVHLHGGGFVMGRADGNLPALQSEAAALDCIIVTVDYRLAPEAPFPAPLQDAYAALTWTYRHCDSLGGDRNLLAVQGESAGGGLAALLALAARDRGEVRLVHQSLIYPMLDDRTGTSPTPFPVGHMAWSGPLNQAAWTAFLGQSAGGKGVPAGAVPARAATLAGLPHTFIGVGSIDLFVTEDTQYANRLIEAEVPTVLYVVPGAFHGFDVAAPETNIVRDFQLAQRNALADAFRTQSNR